MGNGGRIGGGIGALVGFGSGRQCPQGASVFVNKAFSADPGSWRGLDIGIWFEEPIVDGDNLIFLMKSPICGDPVTLERKDWQGYISINTRTGTINYQAKFQIFQPKGKGHSGLGAGPLHDPNDVYPGTIVVGNTLIAPGLETLSTRPRASCSGRPIPRVLSPA